MRILISTDIEDVAAELRAIDSQGPSRTSMPR